MRKKNCCRSLEATALMLGSFFLGLAFWLAVNSNGWVAATSGGLGVFLLVCAILGSIENAVDIILEAKKPDDSNSA